MFSDLYQSTVESLLGYCNLYLFEATTNYTNLVYGLWSLFYVNYLTNYI